PQNKPATARAKTTAPAPEPAPAEEGMVIPAKEVAAATTAEVLGKKSDEKSPAPKPGEAKSDKDKPDNEKGDIAEKPLPPCEPVGKIDGWPKPKPKKPKPIAVAATPLIGNYQLPPMDILQLPDTTIRPTESKEELMANARLMQQTLAQFDIEVSLGDITKGPTITRYELHPAPGVKLEKITALRNNIDAALKAKRIPLMATDPDQRS